MFQHTLPRGNYEVVPWERAALDGTARRVEEVLPEGNTLNNNLHTSEATSRESKFSKSAGYVENKKKESVTTTTFEYVSIHVPLCAATI